MTAFAVSFGDFLRTSRLGAVAIALVAYSGIAKVLSVTEGMLAWAIPGSLAYARRSGLPNIPEVPYPEIEWETQLSAFLVGLLLIAVAMIAALKLFRSEVATASSQRTSS